MGHSVEAPLSNRKVFRQHRPVTLLQHALSDANSLSFRGDTVKCSIPKKLYLEIAKVQVEEKLDWDRACARAAMFLDQGSQAYRRELALEVKRQTDSTLMATLNKARDSIRRKAFEQGVSHALNTRSTFSVRCRKCGKPMRMLDTHRNWDKISETLQNAFAGWSHGKCPN
jgi:hypothetical protein